MNLNFLVNQIINSPQMQRNPIMSNAMQMYRNGDTQGLKTLCENVCKERGLDLNQYANEVMAQFK